MTLRTIYRFVFILLAIIMEESLIAEEYNIDDIVKIFNEKSRIIEIQNIELGKIKYEKDKIYFENNFKFTLSSNTNHYFYEDEKNLTSTLLLTENRGRYPGTVDINILHDIFYLKYNFDMTSEKTKRENVNIGISKQINDFFYDEKQFKEKIMAIEEKLTRERLNAKHTEKINEIIGIYVEIKNREAAVELKLKLIEELKEEITIMERKQEIGEAVKYDIEFLKIELTDTKNEIEKIKKQVDTGKKELFSKIGITNIEKKELKPIENIEIYEIKINDYSIKEIELGLESSNEELNLIKRNNQWIFNYNFDYDIEKKIWKTGIAFRGDIFNPNYNERIKRAEIKKKNIEKLNIADEMEIKKRKLTEEYEALKNDYEIALWKMNIQKERISYIEEMHLNGYMNALDFIKELRNIRDVEYNLEKSRNNLNIFKYKMKYTK